MTLTDYSSIFELLCGYNFVNAVNDTDALKFLDFTTPVKEKIKRIKTFLELKLNSFLEGNGQEKDDLNSKKELVLKVAGYQHRIKELETKMHQHDVKVSNLYLIAGIFCFFILLFSGVSESYIKYNSYILLAAGTLFLYVLFLFCDFIKKKEVLKYAAVIGLGILFVLLLLQQFHILIKPLNRQDNLYCVFIISVTLLLLLILLRKIVIRRKSHKAFFIILFLLFLFVPDTKAFYTDFYTTAQKVYSDGIIAIVVVSIIVSLIPFGYDVVSHISFEAEIETIKEEVEREDFQRTSEREGMTLSDRDLNPIQI